MTGMRFFVSMAFTIWATPEASRPMHALIQPQNCKNSRRETPRAVMRS